MSPRTLIVTSWASEKHVYSGLRRSAQHPALLKLLNLDSSMGARKRLAEDTPTVSKAHAIIGRPLTPFSVAGVHRRAIRRTYGIGANLGYSGYYHRNFGPYAYNRFGYGAGYYGAGYGYGYPAYGYGYGTGYGYPAYGYGYRPGIVRRGLYARAWRHWR
jgi:hypothetical protein